jgi:hypothetical protein
MIQATRVLSTPPTNTSAMHYHSYGLLEGAKSRATLTPPLKSPRSLILLGKAGIEGVIFRVQP